MKLYELLLETPQEDKVLIQLAKVINASLPVSNGRSKKPINVGTVQQFVDQLSAPSKTLLGDRLSNVRIELHSAKDLQDYVAGGNTNAVKQDLESKITQGYWAPDGEVGDRTSTPSGKIVIPRETVGTQGATSVIAHELRHVLDDSKSNMAAADSKTYNTPKKKEHRDNEHAYTAQPAEINARYVQAMDSLTRAIPIIYRLPAEKIRPRVKQAIDQAFENNQISQLFPEKARSKEYKQLIKRAINFVQNEMTEHEELLASQGREKYASGNW